ncbi:MAG: hypothetical protein GF364_06650 [Candidatus Lokiarchaeota archaeon]|nr:hypothetical protein [Candidatus Lokiarchaeota archaeon]
MSSKTLKTIVELNFRITDSTTNPIISSSKAFALAAKRYGLMSISHSDFPSRKTGGFKWDERQFSSHYQPRTFSENLDVIIALDEKSLTQQVQRYPDKFGENTLIILNKEDQPDSQFDPNEFYGTNSKFFYVPFSRLAAGSKNTSVSAFGYLGSEMGIPQDILEKAFTESFSNLPERHLNALKKSLSEGYNYKEQKDLGIEFEVDTEKTRRMLIDGNQALAEALLNWEVTNSTVYPITPATSIYDQTSDNLSMIDEILARGGVHTQTISEIESFGIAIGHIWGGVRNGTQRIFLGTSDPGISLGGELLGLVYELPMVVANVMRGTPSTGLPTMTSQSGLRQAISPTHGDARFPVIAPRTVDEMFTAVPTAYNIAEKLSIPVFLLSDRELSIRQETIKRPDLRKLKPTQPPKRSDLPLKYTGLLSYEDTGLPIPPHDLEAIEQTHLKMYSRIDYLRENDLIIKPRQDLDFYDPLPGKDNEKKIAILPWGSTWYAARDAVDLLSEELSDNGYDVHLISSLQVYPLQKILLKRIKEYDMIFVPEVNSTGQFAEVLREETKDYSLNQKVKSILNHRNVMFTPEEIYNQIKGELMS